MAITLWIGGANAAPVWTGVYADMYLKPNTFPNGLMEEKVFLDKDKSSEITGHVGSQKATPLVKIASTTNFPVTFSFPKTPFLWDIITS